MTIISNIIKEWAKAHSTSPDDVLLETDAQYAEAAGLPTLAALIRLIPILERTPQGRALVAEHFASLVHIARGEATERLRVLTGDERVSCPGGVGAVPKRLLESDHRMVTVEQAIALCDEWETTRGHSAPAIRAACARGDLPAELRGKVWHIAIAGLEAWSRANKRLQRTRSASR